MAILSLSSEFETGALEVGDEICKALGYRCIGLKALLDETKRTAQRMRLYSERDCDESIYRREGNRFHSFITLLQSAILEHAAEDNVVLLTRGSNHLLQEIPHAIRVRFEAPLEYRIERIVTREGVSRETARLIVKQADREVDCSLFIGYGEESDNPESYDIKFDTSAQRVGEILELVTNLLTAKDARKPAGAEALLRRKALAARIKAKIVLHPGLYTSALHVEPRGEGIWLRGVVRGPAERAEIESASREIAGPVSLICELKSEGAPRRKKR